MREIELKESGTKKIKGVKHRIFADPATGVKTIASPALGESRVYIEEDTKEGNSTSLTNNSP